MELLKTHWIGEGDNVHLRMPFAKVDQEHRTVSGFASLNNIDKTDDIVTAEASASAFMEFRGNIREMHQSIAAGRMVSFSQEPYYDQNTGNTYQGIYVTVYVSKGAPDTWEKVLDGTLSGFSIGAKIIEQHTEYIDSVQKLIRFITKLDLFELSLVDNPANQFANVLSIVKVDGELVAKGIATEAETQNVFWCEEDRAARASSEESASCAQCSGDMKNIGWIEVADSEKELKKFMDEWTSKVITAAQIKEELGKEQVAQNSEFANEENPMDNNDNNADKSEGGVNVSDVETVEKAVEVEEIEETTEKAEAAEEAVEPVEETVEKAEEVVEETVEEDAVVKAMNEIKTFVSEAVEKSASEQATFAESLAAIVEEVKKSTQAIASLADSLKEEGAKVSEVAEKVSEVGEKVEHLERDTAVKKSVNDDSVETVEKGFSWGGHFASASTITN